MRRVAKQEGPFNIVIEEVDRPAAGPTEVLIQAERTLISRGSEIWRRYVEPGPIDPQMMGYSLAGVVTEVGEEATDFAVGDRVAAVAPHAEYVAVDVAKPRVQPAVVPLPAALSCEAGTFWPLVTSSVLWVQESGIGPGQTLAILGQGLVGSLCLQVARADTGARILAVDLLPLRCEMAARLGANEVINGAEEDAVEAVRRLTGGEGADVVMYTVGGRAGARAFVQAQEMVKPGGLLHVIGLYEGEPLPLDSGKIMGRRLIGGYFDQGQRPDGSSRAIQLLVEGGIQAGAMVTHRFPFTEAGAAFDLLYHRLGETMAVILAWDPVGGP